MTATSVPTTTAMTRRGAPERTGRGDAPRLQGRTRLLDRVERALAEGRPVNLRGGPGVGKSELLRALAHRHQGPVRLVAGTAGDGEAPCVRDVPEGDRQLLLLVDDAQLLPRLHIARIHALQAQPWCRVVATVAIHAEPDERLGSWWDTDPWRRVEVTPLDRRATSGLIAQLLGGPAEPRLVHEVWRITGGNPIAIQELLHDAQETGCVRPGADSWRSVAPLPLKRLGALVEPRLEGLSEAAQHALRVLAMASPLPVRAAASLVDPRAARELESRGLVRCQASTRGHTLAIIDAVHAEVVRGALLPEQRGAVLEELADTFDRIGVQGRRRSELARWRAEIGGWSAAELARGSALAHGRGDTALAGDLAAAALATGDEPMARWVASLSTTERCAGSPVDPTTGRSACGGGDVPAPQAVDGVVGPGSTEVDALVRAHAVGIGTGRWDAAIGELLARPAPEQDPLAAAGRQAYAAVLRVLGGDVPSAAEHVTAAQLALDAQPQAAAVTDGTRAQAGDIDPDATAVLLAVAQALSGLHAADREQVEDAVDALAATGTRSPSPPLVSSAEHLLAGAQVLTDADRPLRERIVEASDEVDGSLRSFGAETGWWYAVEGWLRWEAGDLATARDRLVAAMLACRSADPLRLRGLVLADLAVLAGLTGSAVEAEWRLGQIGADREHNLAVAHRCELAEVLVRSARHGTHGAGVQLLALADRARQQGRVRDAVTAWHLVARLGCDPAAARAAAAELGAHQQQGSDPSVGAARAHVSAWAARDAGGLEQAARRLAAQGRTLVAAEAAHQAARSGAGPRAAALAGALLSACTDASTTALEGCTAIELSPRRRDAAVLAMAGMDGRSIADRLGVSVRTVENHLARVYRQVGVAGRQELSELFAAGQGPFAGATTA